jgi:hypothetical protein
MLLRAFPSSCIHEGYVYNIIEAKAIPQQTTASVRVCRSGYIYVTVTAVAIGQSQRLYSLFWCNTRIFTWFYPSSINVHGCYSYKG